MTTLNAPVQTPEEMEATIKQINSKLKIVEELERKADEIYVDIASLFESI